MQTQVGSRRPVHLYRDGGGRLRSQCDLQKFLAPLRHRDRSEDLDPGLVVVGDGQSGPVWISPGQPGRKGAKGHCEGLVCFGNVIRHRHDPVGSARRSRFDHHLGRRRCHIIPCLRRAIAQGQRNRYIRVQRLGQHCRHHDRIPLLNRIRRCRERHVHRGTVLNCDTRPRRVAIYYLGRQWKTQANIETLLPLRDPVIPNGNRPRSGTGSPGNRNARESNIIEPRQCRWATWTISQGNSHRIRQCLRQRGCHRDRLPFVHQVRRCRQ